MISRRKLLKAGLVAGAAGAVGTGGLMSVKRPAEAAHDEFQNRYLRWDGPLRWGFVVDTNRCVGCGLCVKACKLENEVPLEASVSRTWVERYVLTKDDNVYADSPEAGLNGYTHHNPIGHRHVAEDTVVKAFFVPKLCNQCDNPPCVQVCPVGATYQTADGVVLVDRTWCIGCGYCIMACPYGVRFFHPKYHVAEKCNFCYHRITKGMDTACVEACPFGARKIGNIVDPKDEIHKIVTTERVMVLKDEYGTNPRVFYKGLDDIVR